MSQGEFSTEGARYSLVKLGIAQVLQVRVGHSKDIKDKRLYCDLEIDVGVRLANVEFTGGTVDIETKNPHGVFFPPVPKQMVGFFYVQGHFQNPIVCFSIPHPWGQGQNRKLFDNILEDIEDAVIFHKSGTRIVMKKDGKLTLRVTDGDKVFSEIEQDKDGNILVKSFDGTNQQTEISQKNDGDLILRNFVGGTEKGKIALNKTTGQVDINGKLTVDV